MAKYLKLWVMTLLEIYLGYLIAHLGESWNPYTNVLALGV
jgi:hypothetical protein